MQVAIAESSIQCCGKNLTEECNVPASTLFSFSFDVSATIGGREAGIMLCVKDFEEEPPTFFLAYLPERTYFRFVRIPSDVGAEDLHIAALDSGHISPSGKGRRTLIKGCSSDPNEHDMHIGRVVYK
jgi:hypothetical protein